MENAQRVSRAPLGWPTPLGLHSIVGKKGNWSLTPLSSHLLRILPPKMTLNSFESEHCVSLLASITGHYTQGDVNNRNLLSHNSSGSRQSKTRGCRAASCDTSPPGLQGPSSHCVLTWSSLSVRTPDVCVSTCPLLIRTPVTGFATKELMASF